MKVNLHSFCMGDVEDLDIYIAQPIYEWQQTTKGKWCMEHATNLLYWPNPDPYSYGYKVLITGELDQPHAVEFFLRWGNSV